MVKQHLEIVLYKPVCHRGFKVSCARTYPHSYEMLRNSHLTTCCGIGWSIAVGPLSATVVPLHLTQFEVPFAQIVTTSLLARHVILHYFL